MSQHREGFTAKPHTSMPLLDNTRQKAFAEIWNRRAKEEFQIHESDSQLVMSVSGNWSLCDSNMNIEGFRFSSPFIHVVMPCHATKSGVVEAFHLTENGVDFVSHFIREMGLTPSQCIEAGIEHKSLKLDVKVSGDIGTDPEPKKGTPVHMVILVGQTKENWQRHRVAYITTHKKVAATVQKQLRTLGHMTKLAETELDLPDNMTLDNKTDLTPAQLAESLKIKANDK